MLSSDDDGPEEAEGFLMDLELALVNRDEVQVSTLADGTQVKHIWFNKDLTMRGAPVTVSSLFVSWKHTVDFAR